MNVAAMPTVECPSTDEEAMTLRQWACFPQSVAGHVPIASPHVFRLLVESSGRRLAIATVALRTLPDAALAADLARLIDERPFEFTSRERICGEFETRHGVTLDLLDGDLDQDDPLKLTAAIPRAIAQAAVQAGRPGSGAVSLSSLRTSVTEQLTAEWLATRSEFISRLDPEAVAQARAIDGLRPSSYSYLTTVNTVIRRNRSQAMTVFPLLRPVLMTPHWMRCGKISTKAAP